MSEHTTAAGAPTEVKWQPLAALERRVAGVLVEKAKTTPDTYPMSLNAIRAGCNQKSNRSPLIEVEEDASANTPGEGEVAERVGREPGVGEAPGHGGEECVRGAAGSGEKGVEQSRLLRTR